MTTTYATIDELRSWIGTDISANDIILEQCLQAASRDIDAYCRRRFYADTTATARLFFPTDDYRCDIDDLSSTTGLVVKTGPDSTGSYGTTWTVDTDFLLEPVNQTNDGLEGWAWTRLRAIGTKTFDVQAAATDRPTVQVTARWGWPAVPDMITQAALIHANWLFFQRNAPSGSAQIGEFAVRLRTSTAVTMLAPYVKVTDPGIGRK